VIEHISMPITEDFIIVKGTDYVGVGNVLDLLKAVGRKLSKANKKITKLNTQLTVENRRLGAELAIARQLQAIVLPDKKEFNAITHLDINGFMIPADEVGGDYYDVLPQGEHIKIAIGDVTGHGLESGILMLMVQTIMQTLVTQGIHDLKTYLNIINRTVFNNLKRMEIDKNLTLVLLDYHQGCLQICGQHEELLVIRQDKVITIDTLELGFMLGIEADITPFLAVEQIQLAPGDGVVLYTDGITEARNKQGELFGLQRLSQVITAHWQCSAKEIRKAVIEQVYQFTQHQKPVDDMTIVVLKQR
jgi:serine phosphatase RsbU (regulator of sigma subunit)